MRREVTSEHVEKILPDTPADHSTWREAMTSPAGGAICLWIADANGWRWLVLPTAAHAASLEGIVRTIRIELERRESQALIRGTDRAVPEPHPVPEPADHQGGQACARTNETPGS